jgi:aspartate aminotransferase
MSSPISERVAKMEESATIAMAQAARELKSKGADVISLSVGEPDFTTPQYIKDAASRAMEEGYTFYTPVPGYLELRQSIAKKLQRDNGIQCGPNNIAVSTGAKQSIANVILSLVNPGDEVLILAPYWVSYVDIVKFADGIPVIVEGTIENDFKPTAEAIAAAITPKTKAIMYSSPSNPAGALFSKDELEALADVVLSKEDLFVLSDEIYEYINYGAGHTSLAAIDRVADRVVTINGFSKGYAMTGWRVGYICAPEWLVKATQKIQGQTTSGTNSVAQRACIEALENDEARQAASTEMGAAFLRRRDLIVSLLREMPNVEVNVPEGAFYVFPDMSHYFGKKTTTGKEITGANELALYLLNEGHVSTVSGEAFGAPNNIRISFAASDENIIEAMKRVASKLTELS